MKKNRIRKGLMIAVFAIAALMLFTAVVMGLWNAILPAVLGVNTITFTQALGILILSKILFGGFGGGFRGRHGRECRQGMRDKWEAMTPEDRSKFKSEWRNRCGGRWGMKADKDSTENAAQQ